MRNNQVERIAEDASYKWATVEPIQRPNGDSRERPAKFEVRRLFALSYAFVLEARQRRRLP